MKLSSTVREGSRIGGDADVDTSEPLSPRQREILELLKDGKTNKDIAHELGIGVGTVKQHLVALFKKMGVSNRSAAISKSFIPSRPTPLGPDRFDAGEETGPALERRAVAALSLQLARPSNDKGDEAARDLYRVFADVAFDFDAVFLSHGGGRCELIFGVKRMRRHDVLRALRAAFAVQDAFQSKHEGAALKGGLAFGYILASTAEGGEWTGEYLGGGAMTAARAALEDAKAGEIALHVSAATIIAMIGLDTVRGIPKKVPLKADFRWRRARPSAPKLLRGHFMEQEMLRARLRDARTGKGRFVVLQGESGMGKSALAATLLAEAENDGMPTDVWYCGIPDSQPGSDARGMMQRAGSADLVPVAEFTVDFARVPPESGAVLLIEDVHLLPADDMQKIFALALPPHGSQGLVLFTYRGRAPVADALADRIEVLHLKHLPAQKSRDLIGDLLGPKHSARAWVEKTANGVPGFIVRLSQLAMDEARFNRYGPDAVPPCDLFALVGERIESLGLERRLLYAIANDLGPDAYAACPASAMKRAVRGGVVSEKSADGGMDAHIQHPLINWVAASSFVPRERAFG